MSTKTGGLSNIDIFLRIRPVSRPSNKLAWDPIENLVSFNIPKSDESG